MAAGPYDAPGNLALADFRQAGDFPVRGAQQGVTVELGPSQAQLKAGPSSGCFSAASARPAAAGAWAMAEKRFAPPLNLSGHQALGLWVYGDGQGEVLNVQLRSPHHLAGGIGDHYMRIDFTGWRYFELIEPEGARHADHAWPYGDVYSIYRESVQFGQVESLGLWYNHLPPGRKATCYLSPITALPVVPGKLLSPSITVGGATLAFPVEIESGSYLEFQSPSDCKLYGPQGQLLREVKPEGRPPVLEPGENQVEFRAKTAGGAAPRANVTVISRGTAM
jgi:hypothetical protein